MHDHVSPYQRVASSQSQGSNRSNRLTHIHGRNAKYFIAAGLMGIFEGDQTLSLNTWIDKNSI